jgi:multidrug resistance efflux pump
VTLAVVLWGLGVAGAILVAAAPAIALIANPAAAEAAKAVATAGLAVAAGTAVAVRLWLRSVNRIRAGQRTALRKPEPDRAQPLRSLPEGGVVVPLDRDAPAYRPVVPPEHPLTLVIILATIAALFESVSFVAYPYEAGGYFTILPYDSSQLNARVPFPGDELTEVLVNEGDEVKPGQILGILGDWQQKYNLAVARAQLESAEANLQNLLHTPQPTDVELARKQYDAAMARLPYDKAQFDRYAALVVNDTVSRANYDQVLSQYQQDQAAAEVARANYDAIRNGPTPDQIEAARALVRQYTATVAFDEDELERTRIRATSSGVMVTPNPMLLRGKWFAAGAAVFTVEDHHVVQADVQVPETDINNVRLGGPVRLRLWGSPEQTAVGKSVAIAPVGQTAQSANPQNPQAASSNVIRVRAEVPNPDGVLHPNTDGYAKLSGYSMPTWRAFGQMFERFFLVEIWSWIP